MKKLYFIAIALFSFSLNAQIVNIPDAYVKNCILQIGSGF